jgi:hypothetical protein
MDAIQFPILELIQLFICLLICIIISLLTCILLWSIYHHYMMLLEQSLPSSLLNCLPVSLLSRRGLGFLGYRYQIVLSTVGSLPGDCTSKNTPLRPPTLSFGWPSLVSWYLALVQTGERDYHGPLSSLPNFGLATQPSPCNVLVTIVN